LDHGGFRELSGRSFIGCLHERRKPGIIGRSNRLDLDILGQAIMLRTLPIVSYAAVYGDLSGVSRAQLIEVVCLERRGLL
jgi:hypothetical protein